MMATSPESLNVTEKKFWILYLFIFLVGRCETGIITFQVASMSFIPNSGGATGSF